MSQKKLSCPEEIEFLSEAYFDECVERGVGITMSGLARALGFRRSDYLEKYRSAEGYEEFHDAMSAASMKVEQFYEESLFDKRVNVAGPIFALKSRIGLTDKSANEVANMTVIIKGNAAKL